MYQYESDSGAGSVFLIVGGRVFVGMAPDKRRSNPLPWLALV